VKNIIELQQRDSIRCRDCNRRIFEDENIIRIRSLIMVERETQKESLLVIKVLLKKSCRCRVDLEKFFGKQIHIELVVKVNKNWRSNTNMLRRFGYNQ
jgi:GTP-binding protein Era